MGCFDLHGWWWWWWWWEGRGAGAGEGGRGSHARRGSCGKPRPAGCVGACGCMWVRVGACGCAWVLWHGGSAGLGCVAWCGMPFFLRISVRVLSTGPLVPRGRCEFRACCVGGFCYVFAAGRVCGASSRAGVGALLGARGWRVWRPRCSRVSALRAGGWRCVGFLGVGRAPSRARRAGRVGLGGGGSGHGPGSGIPWMRWSGGVDRARAVRRRGWAARGGGGGGCGDLGGARRIGGRAVFPWLGVVCDLALRVCVGCLFGVIWVSLVVRFACFWACFWSFWICFRVLLWLAEAVTGQEAFQGRRRASSRHASRWS